MNRLKHAFICRVMILGSSFVLMSTALAADFTQTKNLAEQGNAIAQYNLGAMYYTGESADQNYHKAAEWFQKSADNGVAIAQYNLGTMYAKGLGVRQNSVTSHKLYKKAAYQGHVSAQHNLGLGYSLGEGVRQDFATAKYWFGLACDNGNQDSCNGYSLINLSPFR